jgi:hypothetical protein
MSGMDQPTVSLECAEMVVVGAQADITVGAHCEKRVSFKAKKIRLGRFKVPDLGARVVTGTDGDGSFKQGRVEDELLQCGVETHEHWTVCARTG